MKPVLVAALLLVAFSSRSEAAPCVRKTFQTQLVKEACEKGGQDAAKAAMQAFSKQHNIKTCNGCHTTLSPTYNLKPDGVAQFTKLGGALTEDRLAASPNVKPVGRLDRPQTAPDAKRSPVVPSGDPKLPFEKYRLANGLEVILSPDPSVPIVSVNVWYHVGSGHETYGRSGFAHLFEHMMFQGSKHVGEDKHFDLLKKVGVTEVNGTTNPDRTNYYETVPSNQIETALWLESDRMGYLLQPPMGKNGQPVKFEDSLKNQIDVVRNERRQNYDNQAYGKTRFAVAAALYPERHPYRYLTIGRHEDLVAASVDDVKNFFKTWYVPANATLAIVGDFDVAATKALVEKWFGKFPASKKPAPVVVPAPTIKATEISVDDAFAKLRRIQFVWHSPANYAEGDAELDFVASALGREGTGRLYKALVYDRPLAQSVQAFQFGSMFSGQFSITVTLRSEASVAEVKKIVAEEVAKIVASPITDKEWRRVIAANEASRITGLETTMGRAQLLQAYNHYLGDPDRITWDFDRYRKTTPEKIRAVAAKYLLPDRMVTAVTLPKGGN
jgi:predicted Zn-dependent peptidase